MDESQGKKNIGTEEDLVQDLESSQARILWDKLGFHRPMGGFWYKLIFELLEILLSVVFAAWLFNLMYPFPESRGYASTFTDLFVLLFTIFDLGTASTIGRFVPEANIKDPKKMVHYIQWFIFYQSITGLMQITIIAIFALYILPGTALAYGIWFVLLISTTQYPGFLGVFKGTLQSLQQFHKAELLEFVQGEAFQRVTEIVFVLLGRYLGSLDPNIGEIMGIAIGAIVGKYLDDFIASAMAAYYLSKALKPYGVTLGQCFRPEFDKQLAKECFVFGVKTGAPGLLTATTKIFSLTLFLTLLPQYTTYVALSGLVGGISATIRRATNANFTPLLTEAYLNGKKKLVQYYNAHAFRFYAINQGFFLAIMIIVFSVLQDGKIFLAFGLNNYLLAIPFIIPQFIARVMKPYYDYPERILYATNRPTAIMIMKVVREGLIMFFLWFQMGVLRIQDLGLPGIIFLLALGEIIAELIKAAILYMYIDKKILKFKFIKWQTFVVPPLVTTILILIFQGLKFYIWDYLVNVNLYLALVISLVVLFLLVIVLYFPLTVYLGGWDENSLRDFNLANRMAGPSRFIVLPIAKMVNAAAKKAQWHNKFKYDETEAFQELKELVDLREKNKVLLPKK